MKAKVLAEDGGLKTWALVFDQREEAYGELSASDPATGLVLIEIEEEMR